MLCAIYTRLSKEDEDKRQSESESIQNQKALLLRYARQQGWSVYHIYCDEDYSGADRLRPDFNRMLEAAQAGKFQVLLCKSQSRFTRDMELVEKYIHGLFPLWGIRFIAVADHADSQIKGNKKARQINGLVNEWYLEDLSENIRMVFDLKRQQGQYIGGFPVYGYRKDPENKHHLLIDPEAAEVVRQIFRWSLEGQGRQRIAAQLNAQGLPSPARYKAERGCGPPVPDSDGRWNKTTVWRILRNEVYTGVMVQGRSKKLSYKSPCCISLPPEQWYRVPGTHEAIIDPESFQAVQRGLALRSRSDGTGTVHPLAGLVHCLDCGSTMCKSSNGKSGAARVDYLRCKRYADSGTQRLCTRHSIRLDHLLELLAARIRSYAERWFSWDALPPPPEDHRRDDLLQEQSTLRGQLTRRETALQELYLDKASQLISEAQFLQLNQAFLQEKQQLEQRLRRVEKALDQSAAAGDTPHETVQALQALGPLPRELALLLIANVEIGERNEASGEQIIHIQWRF